MIPGVPGALEPRMYKNIFLILLLYPRLKNAGALLIFKSFRLLTMVIFGNFLSKNTVFLDEKLQKWPQCAQNMPHGVLFKSGVLYARIRYMDPNMNVGWLWYQILDDISYVQKKIYWQFRLP